MTPTLATLLGLVLLAVVALLRILSGPECTDCGRHCWSRHWAINHGWGADHYYDTWFCPDCVAARWDRRMQGR